MTAASATAEATLCRIFAGVLGLDLVRPQDGFFEVGGDSVLAVQVVARAREAGLALTARDLFDHQSPGALAAAAGELQGAAGSGAAAAPAEPPLMTLANGELDEFEDDEFEDTEAGQQASDTEAGWETVT
jgi:Phosphopantetheine attachment site